MNNPSPPVRISKNHVTSAGIVLAILTGLFFSWGVALKPAIPYVLGGMLYFAFLKLRFEPKRFFRKELVFYPIATYILMPLIAFFATASLPDELRVGFVMVAIAPSATGAPVIAELINADMEVTTAHVAVYNLITPLTFSLIPPLLFRNTSVSMDYVAVFLRLVAIIFIPLFLALVTRRIANLFRVTSRVGAMVNPVLLVLVIGIAVSSAAGKLHTLSPLRIGVTFLVVFIMAVLYFSSGYLLGRTPAVKKALALSFGHKNGALTIWVCLANFTPLTSVPMVMYIIAHHIINSFLLARFHAESANAEEEA